MNTWTNLDTNNFLTYCEKNNINVTMDDNFIMIKTKLADWLIHTDKKGKKLKLLHRNLYKTHSDYHLQREYECQNLNKDILKDIAIYIYKHDKFKSSNKQFRPKKSRMERLFEQIEKN